MQKTNKILTEDDIVGIRKYLTDADGTAKAARQKQAQLEKEISALLISPGQKRDLQHTLSKMGMFYAEVYDDLREKLQSLIEEQPNPQPD